MSDLPDLALSVRQPWAWVIIHAGKDIENRTLGSIRAGGMTCRRICIHAASGMTEREYRWAVWKLQPHGVAVPRAADLIRSAIIGVVDVVDIVSSSDSVWFGGPYGLVLKAAKAITPVPAKGKLGYFTWEQSGSFAEPRPWMRKYGRSDSDGQTAELFGDMARSWKHAPVKPFKSSSKP
jgi:hypothetical protein